MFQKEVDQSMVSPLLLLYPFLVDLISGLEAEKYTKI